MAYNYFPAGYQPYYQAQYNAPTNNGIIWVQGEAGAKSYLVGPNNTVPLWDSESQTIYLKSADASGMPTMKVIDYTIRDSAPVKVPGIAYVTKDEFDALRKQVEKMMEGKHESVVSDDE